MIGSLVRWLGRRSSGRGCGSAPRFTPQLEVLEGRALPGGLSGGVIAGSVAALFGAKVGATSHVASFASKAAGAGDGIFGLARTVTRSSGEEIPQW